MASSACPECGQDLQDEIEQDISNGDASINYNGFEGVVRCPECGAMLDYTGEITWTVLVRSVAPAPE
ncbi:MAG: hypothetical protein M5R40_07225 [Anaerolineae bacterium]|nr:hypothetical protein [Anaerolineae bacterium]